VRDEDILYTLEEVARILRVSVATVRRMIDDKELEAIKVRGQWRVRKEVLDRYLGKTQQ
jgi:excisionase family DNA binding protein